MVILKTVFRKMKNFGCVVSIMCCQHRVCARNWHISQENVNVHKEELPCLSVCIELGNQEDDPTNRIQSLSLTLNSKHRACTKTLVTFAQVTEQ